MRFYYTLNFLFAVGNDKDDKDFVLKASKQIKKRREKLFEISAIIDIGQEMKEYIFFVKLF